MFQNLKVGTICTKPSPNRRNRVGNKHLLEIDATSRTAAQLTSVELRELHSPAIWWSANLPNAVTLGWMRSSHEPTKTPTSSQVGRPSLTSIGELSEPSQAVTATGRTEE